MLDAGREEIEPMGEAAGPFELEAEGQRLGVLGNVLEKIYSSLNSP